MAASNNSDSQTSKDSKKPKEDMGFYFYPERETADRPKPTEKSFMAKLIEGRSAGRTVKCAGNVMYCTKYDPMVKLMMGALRSHGCPVNLERHVSCEDCRAAVNGGFDPTTNQVVICQNNSQSRRVACSVMAHELLHMFDYCRAKVDFTNLEHLACTEIRAANFMHCSYMSALVDGDASPFSIKNKHQECVKRKALMSMLMVRNITLEEGTKIVDKVFDKCYKDMEPFGRIPRRNSRDPDRILSEGYLYGYADNMR